MTTSTMYDPVRLAHNNCTIVALVSLLLFSWCLCLHCTGIFAVLVLGSLPLLRCHLCPPCACWCLHCCCAGIVTLIAMASLPLLHWRLCQSFALVSITLIALASSPLFCWHCHPKPTLLWWLFHCSTGVVTIVVLFVLINSISMLKHFVHV